MDIKFKKKIVPKIVLCEHYFGYMYVVHAMNESKSNWAKREWPGVTLFLLLSSLTGRQKNFF